MTFKFINGFSFKLEEELGKEIDKEIANDMAAIVYWSIMDSVADNCMGECENECLVEHEHNAYCNFCSFASENLPCPKKGNISYEIIKESEKDMIH